MKRLMVLVVGTVFLLSMGVMAAEPKKDVKADEKAPAVAKEVVTKFILVRHGETLWNRDRIYRGTADVPLDDRGKQEAEWLGEWLKNEKIDAAYCSPLSRTRETARAVAKHHKDLKVVDLPDIIDICYGEWQGKPESEVKVKYADLHKQWVTEPQKVRFPGKGGETVDEVMSRTKKALEMLVQRHPGQTVLLASHGAPNRAMLMVLFGWDASRYHRIRQDTTAYNRFNWNKGGWDIISVNETGHLHAAPSKLEDSQPGSL